MKNILIKILFWYFKIPVASKIIDHQKMNEWIGLQYPLPQFHDYIAKRNLHLLQVLGEGIDYGKDYWINVGRRIELGVLLTDAKKNFEIAERERLKNKIKNENTQNKEG